MKKVFASLVLLAAIGCLPAQTWQTGLVRELNSKRTPLPGVQVNFADAVPTDSDNKGLFRLAFRDKKPGDLIFFQEIRKQGYEIVNDKELQVLKIGSTERLGNDIILAKAGKLDAARKEYYAISDKALTAGFKKQEQALKAQLAKLQLTQAEFERQFSALSDQYLEQQKKLDDLSDLFARVNFDDVSKEYREAFDLFESGDIDAALRILEKIDLPNRIKKRLNEKRSLEKASAEIAAQKEKNEREIKEDLQGMQLQAELYVLTFQIEKAELLYDGILRLDSTDLKILADATEFYRLNHRYEKALRWLPKIIANPKSEDWQKANAFGHIGEMHTAIGQLDPALQAFSWSQKAYAEMVKTDPNRSYYKNNLAISYSKLGKIHSALGDLTQALTFYEKFNQLEKELHEAFPQNVTIKNDLAISYEKLGETHTALDNLFMAVIFFEKENKLSKELHEAFPQNMDLKKGLAVSYSKLGETSKALDNLPQALTLFEKDNELSKALYEAIPQNVVFKNDLAISYERLGETYTELGNLTQALAFFEKDNELSKALHEAFPQNVAFKNGLAISCEKLGMTHSAIGNLTQALTFFEKYNQLEKELHEAFPQNVEFKKVLATSYSQLGWFFENNIRDFEKAKFY